MAWDEAKISVSTALTCLPDTALPEHDAKSQQRKDPEPVPESASPVSGTRHLARTPNLSLRTFQPFIDLHHRAFLRYPLYRTQRSTAQARHFYLAMARLQQNLDLMS